MTAAVHAVAAAAMLLALRPGLPPAGDEARMAFIAGHRAMWTVAWLSWSLAAVTLVALVVVLARRSGSVAPVVLVVAGACFDLTSQARYILAMPLAVGGAFRALDRQLEIMIGVLANGLYTLAILALVWNSEVLPRRVRVLAVPVIVAGAVLAVAAWLHAPPIEIVSSAVLFPAFILWSMDVGRWLLRS